MTQVEIPQPALVVHMVRTAKIILYPLVHQHQSLHKTILVGKPVLIRMDQLMVEEFGIGQMQMILFLKIKTDLVYLQEFVMELIVLILLQMLLIKVVDYH